ncbi:hypothetical protein V5799_033621 [Amblyomma americanum]|uniref:Uncharacterized protein n=1 Tax=Amblyomma americanum TaxID=6943 RepID=A0AAQ4DMT1_AMBAM
MEEAMAAEQTCGNRDREDSGRVAEIDLTPERRLGSEPGSRPFYSSKHLLGGNAHLRRNAEPGAAVLRQLLCITICSPNRRRKTTATDSRRAH